MTRTELVRAIATNKALVEKINKTEKTNFTHVKTPILEAYLSEATAVAQAAADSNTKRLSDAYKSAAIAFLLRLDQMGVLEELLNEIR